MEEISARAHTLASSDDFIVGSVPTVIYVPEYISADEQEQILSNIYGAPISKWKSLKNRRLQNWGGVVHEKGLLPQELPHWLTRVTSRICEESGLFPSAINHVLINEYLPDQGIMPHQDGPAYSPVVAILSLGSPVVMDFAPHPSFENESSKPNDADADDNDVMSEPSSMNSEKRLHEYHPFSLVLMPRSLLIFKDSAYSEYLHGIKDCADQRYDEAINDVSEDMKSDGRENVLHRTATRVSLTCRVVTKVHRHLIKL